VSILGHIATTLFAAKAVLAVFWLLALGLSLILAFAVGVFRPRAAVGPERLSPTWPALRLVLALAMGFCSWVLASSLYVTWKGAANHPPGLKHPFSPGDWAYLSTVPPAAFFLTLCFADWAIGGAELLNRLGISIRRLGIGIAKGILAAFIILPPTYLLSAVADQFYNSVKFQHPREHELLKVMQEPQRPAMHWILILAAVLVAPVFEEFLFRGHLQSLLRRGLVLGSLRWRAAQLRKEQLRHGFPLDTQQGLPAAPVIAPNSFADIPIEPAVWQTWTAIVLTSVLFASVHPMWMWPPIFFLSLGLGYSYERTGNLWTAMTVHCLFNSISTIVFLTLT